MTAITSDATPLPDERAAAANDNTGRASNEAGAPAVDQGAQDRRRGAIRAVVGVAVTAAAVIGAAGRLDWAVGWLYVLLVALGSATIMVVVGRHNPELMARRTRLGAGTKWWDKIFLALYLPIVLAMLIVAGLDAVRFGWTSMSPWLGLVGLAAYAAGISLATWAMFVNTHFESSVRIQSDRGHQVVDAGPYRFVRHPGYAGSVLYALATPLLLGSWWAFVPAFLLVDWVIARTALEDATLRRELTGYAAYAKRVRFRLIPWVW